MRWLSLDQKPSWFNNAANTGTYTVPRSQRHGAQPTVRENFAASRERYTIMTTVASWWSSIGPPPNLFVLFRGKPGGRILPNLANTYNVPDWLMLQVQENGSYRSGDMVEALEWILPDAADSSESIIVLLDWFSAHRSEEVAELVRRKGHVLIFHGGGVTPFIQVNDTHLHAPLARLLINQENSWAHSQRQKAYNEGLAAITPSCKREDILLFVESSWIQINHERMARKGYHQTGPELPMEGPWYRNDFLPDLLTVMNKLHSCPEHLEGQVSTAIRDEAIAFVNAEWEAGRLRSWADAPDLIEEHDNEDEPVEEGLEAFGYDPDDSDDSSEAPDGSHDKGDEGGGDPGGGGDGGHGGDDGGSDGGSSRGHLFAPSDDGDDGDDGDGSGGGGGGDAALALVAASHVVSSHPASSSSACAIVVADNASVDVPAPSQRAMKKEDLVPVLPPPLPPPLEEPILRLKEAQRILVQDAMTRGDDALLKRLLAEMQKESKEAKDKDIPFVKRMSARAQELKDHHEKRRKAVQEEHRLAANSREELQRATAVAQAAAHQARLACLEQALTNRRYEDARLAAITRASAISRWLQTEFSAMLAERLIAWYRHTIRPLDRTRFTKEVDAMLLSRFFSRFPTNIPDLWVPLDHLTYQWCQFSPPGRIGGHPRWVRCSAKFNMLIEKYDPPRGMLARNPVDSLYKVFEMIVPRPRQIFLAHSHLHQVIHINDYILDKTFVYGVVMLSKWLGQERLPKGVYGVWPPDPPPEVLPPEVLPPAPPPDVDADPDLGET